MQRITGKVVLQVEAVEERAPAFIPCGPPPGYKDVEGWRREQHALQHQAWRVASVYWRDATPEEACPARIFSAA